MDSDDEMDLMAIRAKNMAQLNNMVSVFLFMKLKDNLIIVYLVWRYIS